MKKLAVVCFVLPTLFLSVPQAFGLQWDTGNIREGIPDFLTLLLDNQDRPRMFFNSSQMNYASCDAGCTNASNWATVSLAPLGLSWSQFVPRGALAVDPAGNPRAAAVVGVPNGVELRYAFCDSGCHDLSNWTTVVAIEETGFLALGYNAAIAVDGHGGVVVAYSLLRDGFFPDYPDWFVSLVMVASCPSGCQDPANWSSMMLGGGLVDFPMGMPYPAFDMMSLKLHAPSPSQVAPRLLYRQATMPSHYVVIEYIVASCDNGCTDQANWNFDTIAGTGGQYAGSVANDIALDASGAYHAAVLFSQAFPTVEQKLYYKRQGAASAEVLATTDIDMTHPPSIGVTSTGYPRIAVHSRSSAALRYYVCDTSCSNPSNWSFETPIPDVKGGTPSLVMGQGIWSPRIVYPNGQVVWLQYATGWAGSSPWSAAGEAEASVAGGKHPNAGSRAANALAFFVLPALVVAGWIGLRRRGSRP